MFVYIVGSSEQNVFKLGVAEDPFQKLSQLQAGNPYKLSVLCKICVDNKNAAALVEALGHRDLKKYEGAGGWYVSVPDVLSAQFVSDHYLRLLASRADVRIRDRTRQTSLKGQANLQRLTPIAVKEEWDFDNVLKRVEYAYDRGVPIDKLFNL